MNRSSPATLSNSGERPVPLIPAAKDALRAQHARVLQYRLRAGQEWRARDLVFPDERGEFVGSRRVHRVFKQHVRKAGLDAGVTPHVTPHALRHSTGTYLTAAGVPDRVVMAILGHSNMDMTRRYQHVMTSMLSDAAERLARMFPAAQSG